MDHSFSSPTCLHADGLRGVRPESLPRALSGVRSEFDTPDAGRLSWYDDRPQADSRRPLLLIHSVNAAGSAYDVKPIFEHYRRSRPVYALELPGFGFSERSDRSYTPQLMAGAIQRAVARIRGANRGMAVDAIAVALSCEFLARAAIGDPNSYRTVGFVSPTGFENRALRECRADSTLTKPLLLAVLNWPGWRRSLFSLLTRKSLIRYSLRQARGGKAIDAGLLDYAYATSRPAGAEYAPIQFIAGCLTSADSGRLYRNLRLPVWIARGKRGDFHGYPGLVNLASRPNWTIEVMNTGALPHFEELPDFVDRYESWLADQEWRSHDFDAAAAAGAGAAKIATHCVT
jgi:hypothetical protein